MTEQVDCQTTSSDISPQVEIRPSKSLETLKTPVITPEKSVSLTLAERRNIPASTEKLRLYAEAQESQISQDYLLARLEKQAAILNADPKSICIDSTPLLTELEARLLSTSIHFPLASLHSSPLDSKDADYYKSLVSSCIITASQAPNQLLSRLSLGLPAQLRGLIWQTMAQSSATHLLALYDDMLSKENESPYKRAIEKDVAQCFESELFAGVPSVEEGQQALVRVLSAYSVYDARVGYCHGMAYLAAPLLMTMPEKEAFSVLVRLMETYEMRNLYMLNMEGLHLHLHQFQALLAQRCPELDQHLNQLGIHPSMYATQWFLTLFAYALPASHTLRVYDLVFVEGAVETAMRLAIVIMQRNENMLLSMTQFEQVLAFMASSTTFENEDDLIHDMLALGDIALKMDNIAENHAKGIEREKNRAHQMLAVRFNKKARKQQRPESQDRMVPLLHQQIEDLVTALSQLQKEHTALSEDNMSLRMQDMDQEAAQSKLLKRNSVLEKRVKKYKVKLANATAPVVGETESFKPVVMPKLDEKVRKDQFSSFVNSLRDSGDFGALIAGALDTKQFSSSERSPVQKEEEQQQEQREEKEAAVVVEKEEPVMATTTAADHQRIAELEQTLTNVTSELVAIKLDRFETQQKYDTLFSHCEDLNRQLEMAHEQHTILLQKIVYLTSELEDCQNERDQIYQDQEDVLEKAMIAKKTSAELQLEKMGLAKDVERLEQLITELENEKKSFFMPRSTFSEEVFAAHSIIFGPTTNNKQPVKKDLNRRHTLQLGKPTDNDDQYQTKLVESELRCRELEKYLAEAKVKLVELEASASPRGSMQLPRRSSVQIKRSSTASLSMLANRMSTPTSPREPRESTESYASSITSVTSSSYNSKRSSMYSRIWNAFGTPTLPMTPMKNTMMCDEPQII
ncbi:hypothetical protein K501DRAFT_333940 [Backusella circina FSU 941]|nr:hypothetical protein K501DRAFT_333940 [Backusella circina FSU 941]